MKSGGKLLITIAALLALSGCTMLRNAYLQRPEEVGRQPTHLMPHKDQLYLKGPVKRVTYYVTRPDFTGSQSTSEAIISFNKNGYVTEITGDERLLKTYDLLQHWDLPANTRISYYRDTVLDTMETANPSHQYEYKAEPLEYSEKTGNLKSFVFKHTRNRDTSSEKKYRTLNYMIYAHDRYMVLEVDNRKREETQASIYEFQGPRLHKVYVHENDYPLDKAPAEALGSPLNYRFSIARQIDYDHQGRVSRVLNTKDKGLYQTEERYSYFINSDFPKRVTNTTGQGAQQFQVSYSAYEKDAYDNWTSREVVSTYRRGDKEGNDKRVIEYYEVD